MTTLVEFPISKFTGFRLTISRRHTSKCAEIQRLSDTSGSTNRKVIGGELEVTGSESENELDSHKFNNKMFEVIT